MKLRKFRQTFQQSKSSNVLSWGMGAFGELLVICKSLLRARCARRYWLLGSSEAAVIGASPGPALKN